MFMDRSRMFRSRVNGPMIQINDDYYEDLDEKNTEKIISSLMSDRPLEPKSYKGRTNTAPEKSTEILNGEKMLKEENKIFKNLYNNFGWEIDNAIKRDDWKILEK